MNEGPLGNHQTIHKREKNKTMSSTGSLSSYEDVEKSDHKKIAHSYCQDAKSVFFK